MRIQFRNGPLVGLFVDLDTYNCDAVTVGIKGREIVYCIDSQYHKEESIKQLKLTEVFNYIRIAGTGFVFKPVEKKVLQDETNS